jgi:hypothetical protein
MTVGEARRRPSPRSVRNVGELTQLPFAQVRRTYAPIEVLEHRALS